MATTETEVVQGIGSDYEIKYGFHVAEDYFFKSGRGVSHELIDAISSHKDEPDWMRKFRHKSLDYFLARPMPTWGPDLTTIDFEPAGVAWRGSWDRSARSAGLAGSKKSLI
jgi:Fe-S cluster assembly protein SufB